MAGLLNVKINEKLWPMRNTLYKNTASDVLIHPFSVNWTIFLG